MYDIILKATTIKDAHTMLDLVCEFSTAHQFKFNPDKIFEHLSDNET